MQMGAPVKLSDGRTVRPLAVWEGRLLVIEFLGQPDRPEELREWVDLPTKTFCEDTDRSA